MGQAIGAGAATDLQRLCETVGRWRAHREGPKSRVPEALWDEAVRVARVEGLHATARALHFNYKDLKNRIDLAAGSPEAGLDRTTFVEVQMPAIPAVRVEGRVVVELLGSRGERMRIEADPGALDLAGLARTFWSREP